MNVEAFIYHLRQKYLVATIILILVLVIFWYYFLSRLFPDRFIFPLFAYLPTADSVTWMLYLLKELHNWCRFIHPTTLVWMCQFNVIQPIFICSSRSKGPTKLVRKFHPRMTPFLLFWLFVCNFLQFQFEFLSSEFDLFMVAEEKDSGFCFDCLPVYGGGSPEVESGRSLQNEL